QKDAAARPPAGGSSMRISLPDVLSANAGYVDTAGFLALNGLFTSHVTGNFVTLGSSLVLGTSGALAKVLALPVFCLTVFLLRLLGQRHKGAGHSALRALLTLQFTLLVAGAAHATSKVNCQVSSALSAERSEEHTSELQSQSNLVCRLLLEKKKQHILNLLVHPPVPLSPIQVQRHAHVLRV